MSSQRAGSCYAFYFFKFDDADDYLDCWAEDKRRISFINRQMQSRGKPGYCKHRFNLTLDQFKDDLEAIRAHENSSKSDYLLFYILSHGDKNAHFIARDSKAHSERIRLTDIFSHFSDDNCPRFAGKPKIFIIQSCHGGDEMHQGEERGQTDLPSRERRNVVDRRRSKRPESWNNELLRIRRSLGKNMFYAYAATPDKEAYCNERGSFFTSYLQEECREENRGKRLTSLMTRVNMRMAQREDTSYFVSRLSEDFVMVPR